MTLDAGEGNTVARIEWNQAGSHRGPETLRKYLVALVDRGGGHPTGGQFGDPFDDVKMLDRRERPVPEAGKDVVARVGLIPSAR